jgi:hypothetical protein
MSSQVGYSVLLHTPAHLCRRMLVKEEDPVRFGGRAFEQIFVIFGFNSVTSPREMINLFLEQSIDTSTEWRMGLVNSTSSSRKPTAAIRSDQFCTWMPIETFPIGLADWRAPISEFEFGCDGVRGVGKSACAACVACVQIQPAYSL